MFRINRKKAQSTLEYAVLIGVIAGALIAIQVYVKRGFQGKLRESADSMGEQFSAEHTAYNLITNSTSTSAETVASGITTTEITKQSSNRTRNEAVNNLDTEP